MEKIVWQTLLFDFYGELLTTHQQEIYDAVVLNDTGFSEVAQEKGITRQGVHDLVRRTDRQLEEYEEKLHLVEKFLRIRDDVRSIKKLAQAQADMSVQGRAGASSQEGGPAQSGTSESPNIRGIIDLADEILEEL